MSLDLEELLVFYGTYHHNNVNIIIHMVCVPIILVTYLWIAANAPVLIPLPTWLTIPLLPLNLATLIAVVYGAFYVLLEPVAGGALALLCLGSAAVGNFTLANYDARSITTYAVAANVAAWIIQFIGHGKFEGRAPALMDNLVQAIFLAPLFVWLELLFAFGYRPELHGRVQQMVQKELSKLRAEKTAAVVSASRKNGKAQ